jgi:hypothetical protein
MQSTLKVSKKTHPRVLPQLRALKVPLDAPAKVKAGTGETGSLLANQADFQHGRGERPAPSDGAGPSPSPQGEEKSGVTRVFKPCRISAFLQGRIRFRFPKGQRHYVINQCAI